MRRALPAAAVTVIGLIALASFRTTRPTLAAGPRPASSHRLVQAAPRTPTTTAPAGAPPPPTAGATTPRTTPPTQAAGPSGTFDGDPFSNEYGTVQVQVTLEGGHLTAVTALQMPFEHERSQFISQQAEPLLRQEALQAQSAQIDLISGATYTSDGYAQSLQSALDRAHA